MKRLIQRVGALTVGLILGVTSWAGLETVTHISDLNASWPLGSDLASTSDDHIRNIKTALKTDFPNINGTWSSASAPPFAPATDTNTGLYFPSADDLALATGGTKRFEIGSAGNITLTAPTSGTALTVNGLTANYSLIVNAAANAYGQRILGSSTTNQSFGLQMDAGTSSSDEALRIRNQAGTASYFFVRGDGQISGAGPTAATLVDMTPDTGTFTGVGTGMTGTVNYSCTWSRIGKLAMLNCGGASGTSNSTSYTMTGLPSAIQPASLATRIQLNPMIIQDNGSTVGTSSIVEASVAASSGTITFLKGGLTTGWTNANAKGIAVGSSITLAYPLN